MATTPGVIDAGLELLAAQLGEPEPESTAGHRPGPRTLETLRSSGLLGAAIPTEYGGTGGDALVTNRIVSEVARHDPSLAIVVFQHLAVSARIVDWGTAEQKARYLPRLATGDWLAASAWSEAGAGADKKNLSTKAEREPDGGWTLNGTKHFTTGAGLADMYLVLTQTDEAVDTETTYGAAGQTFFLVDAKDPGLTTDTKLDLEGMRTSATGTIRLEGCQVPDGDVLGAVGEAPRIIATVRESGATLGAVSVGIAQAAYDTVAAQVARSGGLASQSVRHGLVDLRVLVEAARVIVEHAGRRVSPEPGLTTLYSKLFASMTAEQVCQQALALLGSAGYLCSNPVNRLSRDARAVALMGPTNDLCRELVSASWQK